MPLNLELKIKVDSHAKFISTLEKIGAEYKGILIQKDVYYSQRDVRIPPLPTSRQACGTYGGYLKAKDRKNGLLKLRIENGSYTLIKYLRDEEGKRWSDYELLRIEGKDPEKYLSALFDVETIIIKRRKFYLYENTRVHLDVVKGLGKFLELETLLMSNRKDAEKRFKKVVKLLGLDLSKQIHSSYKNLLLGK